MKNFVFILFLFICFGCKKVYNYEWVLKNNTLDTLEVSYHFQPNPMHTVFIPPQSEYTLHSKIEEDQKGTDAVSDLIVLQCYRNETNINFDIQNANNWEETSFNESGVGKNHYFIYSVEIDSTDFTPLKENRYSVLSSTTSTPLNLSVNFT